MRPIPLTLLLLMFSFISAANAQADVQSLPFVSIVDLGENGRNYTPARDTLSAAEEKAFRDSVGKLRFPDYIFAGCAERAHAAWVLLPAPLKDKVSKVWIAAASKHSASVKGMIRLSPNVPGSIDVRWGYHAALGYKNQEGLLQIYDGCIARGRVLEGSMWFAALRPDPLSFWTMTAGRLYMFDEVTIPGSANQAIWNGSAREYSAASRSIPESLARDAVGDAILKDRECEVLRSEAKDGGTLLERLKKANVPAGCENLLTIFKRELQVWAEKVSSARP